MIFPHPNLIRNCWNSRIYPDCGTTKLKNLWYIGVQIQWHLFGPESGKFRGPRWLLAPCACPRKQLSAQGGTTFGLLLSKCIARWNLIIVMSVGRGGIHRDQHNFLWFPFSEIQIVLRDHQDHGSMAFAAVGECGNAPSTSSTLSDSAAGMLSFAAEDFAKRNSCPFIQFGKCCSTITAPVGITGVLRKSQVL